MAHKDKAAVRRAKGEANRARNVARRLDEVAADGAAAIEAAHRWRDARKQDTAEVVEVVQRAAHEMARAGDTLTALERGITGLRDLVTQAGSRLGTALDLPIVPDSAERVAEIVRERDEAIARLDVLRKENAALRRTAAELGVTLKLRRATPPAWLVRFARENLGAVQGSKTFSNEQLGWLASVGIKALSWADDAMRRTPVAFDEQTPETVGGALRALEGAAPFVPGPDGLVHGLEVDAPPDAPRLDPDAPNAPEDWTTAEVKAAAAGA